MHKTCDHTQGSTTVVSRLVRNAGDRFGKEYFAQEALLGTELCTYWDISSLSPCALPANVLMSSFSRLEHMETE